MTIVEILYYCRCSITYSQEHSSSTADKHHPNQGTKEKRVSRLTTVQTLQHLHRQRWIFTTIRVNLREKTMPENMPDPQSKYPGKPFRIQLTVIPEEYIQERKNLEIVWNTDELELHDPSSPVQWRQLPGQDGHLLFVIPKHPFNLIETPHRSSPRRTFGLTRNNAFDPPYDPSQAMMSGALEPGEPIEIDDHPALTTGRAMGEEDPLISTQTKLEVWLNEDIGLA
jgi:hypothetical protein